MATQKGYRIKRRKGKTGIAFTVEVRSRKAGTYISTKTFNSRDFENGVKEAESAAKEWGATESAKVKAGIRAGHSGRVSTSDILKLFFKNREARSLNGKHESDMQNVLADLSLFCPNLADPKAAKHVFEWWQDWAARLTPSGTSKSVVTQNRGLIHAKTFVNWCYKSRQLTNLEQPVVLDWVEKLREEKTVKAQFTVDEMRKGFSVTTMPRSGVIRPHSYVILWAIYIYLGLRAREGLNLRWDHFEGGHVFVSGKGKKQRLVPMQTELAPHLELHRKKNDHDGHLFPKHMRECDSSDPAKRLNSFLKKAGIERKGRSTHSLRHCYAGMMTATGEPTALLQAYMGHSQSDMTMHYAQMAARYRQDVEGWERGKITLNGKH